MRKRGLVKDIGLVPVDADGDGHIGTFEKIYTFQPFYRPYLLGAFHEALYSPIYALSNDQPVNEPERAFLEWLVNNGQEMLVLGRNNGAWLRRTEFKNGGVVGQERAMANVQANTSPARIYLVVGGFFTCWGFWYYALARITGEAGDTGICADFPMGDETTEFPDGFFFDNSHTWAFMEKSGG